MSLIEHFAEVRSRCAGRSMEELTFVAYMGRAAERELYCDEEIGRQLMLSQSGRLSECYGIKLVKDKDSPEPELVKFFIDGVHLFTLNTETKQLMEITPSDSEDTIWQLDALGRYFNGRDAVSAQVPRLVVRRPVSPRDLTLEGQDVSDAVLHTVDFSEMVTKGILRYEDTHVHGVYRLTHQGRIASSAAMHFSATYQAQTRSQFEAINRALMDM